MLGVDQSGMLHESFKPTAASLFRQKYIESLPSKPKVKLLNLNWVIKLPDVKIAGSIDQMLGIRKDEKIDEPHQE